MLGEVELRQAEEPVPADATEDFIPIRLNPGQRTSWVARSEMAENSLCARCDWDTREPFQGSQLLNRRLKLLAIARMVVHTTSARARLPPRGRQPSARSTRRAALQPQPARLPQAQAAVR